MSTKALIVEDEEHIRSVLSDFLGTSGYEVESVSSGEEGLESLAKQPADLMIVDLKMPGISGLEFAEEVTDRSRTARLPSCRATGI